MMAAFALLSLFRATNAQSAALFKPVFVEENRSGMLPGSTMRFEDLFSALLYLTDANYESLMKVAKNLIYSPRSFYFVNDFQTPSLHHLHRIRYYS